MVKLTPADWLRRMGRDDYFFLEPDDSIDESRTWWDDLAPWFQGQGYTLYRRKYPYSDNTYYVDEPTLDYSAEPVFPYAHIGGDCAYGCTMAECSLHLQDTYPRLVFAQDSQSRHVCIKLLRPNSDEYKIIKFLQEQSKSWTEDTFPYVVPVLDVISNTKYHFAVFPRWDGALEKQYPYFNTFGEVLDSIRCMLKGLCYLHDNRIFHRDIHDGNILSNHFGCAYDYHMENNLLRQELRSTGRLMYALTDFDLSLMLPATVDVRTFRLPISESWPGAPDKPYGAIHGELYFNPFAFDVACLGITFAERFQHLCASCPVLSPLIGGMLTANIDKRFTAHDALIFFDENRPKISDYEALTPQIRDYRDNWKTYDRWSSMPPEFLQVWSKYREQQPSYFMQWVVGPLCRRIWGQDLVYSIRSLLRFEFLKPVARWLGWTTSCRLSS